mmetsp:Transcript_14438/g.27900  ORF Transcript_14438/g.27900 Transcript_14438/m.27900 type:complete len:211 (+) Transcript_14438:278-910(+)|eukprot:CAMPEP_0197478446 /NCGR_PEP_ID=MMETSP1309-20131121/26593_1 /TAXON_ID=464262 /ORGANISM="Genus nov. species nov., Strain RCC998" /LENGTH=210 /DNA_ID=CAMNT_0043019831 /DNA_START=559 /DNA_END=1191 /DNA_ORIENTATION=+
MADPVTTETENGDLVLTQKKERKVRNVWAVPYHRDSEKNRLLVNEVLKQNPFTAKFGRVKAMWDSISEALNKEDIFTKSQCDHQGCQNQVKKLVDYWERRRSVRAQLNNKLSEWEKILEKLVESKHQSEFQKRKKVPVMSFEEEMAIYNQGGSSFKRAKLDDGILEVDNTQIANITKQLEEQAETLKRLEVMLAESKEFERKVLASLGKE